MRAFVFTDRSLARQAGRFVWLSIDIEKASNAPFLKKFPVNAVPTLLIIDPAKEVVSLRWLGGATVPQLQKLLADGLLAVHGGGKGPDGLLAEADRLGGAGKTQESIAAYRRALAAAPSGWSRYSRATESLLAALQTADQNLECATTARLAFPKLAATPSAANVAASGLDCALALPVTEKERAELVASLEKMARAVLADHKTRMAADDKSAVYQEVISARQDAKDEKGVHRAREEWAGFLEGEAGKAKTADGRAVFDSHRLSAYLDLAQPERAIPMLQASERDLPNDYNPPARMAVALKAMGRWDDALAASDRALAKAYGPRRLGMLRTRAEIYEGKGDKEAAKKTLSDAITMAESLPQEQRSERTVAALKKKLESLQ
jgi:tetratricopeptide (TPR) repeat protein